MSPRRRRGLAANPVLVGSVTVVVVLVAVFLSYNANSGLPFVPTYDLTARVANAANLVPGNEVRIGGARVGIVTAVEPVRTDGGRAVAELKLKLDANVDPLPIDSTFVVRPVSALGLKYVAITPGDSRAGFPEGATVPLTAARPEPVELDEFFNMFDAPTRRGIQLSLQGFGNGLAGRGPDLNEAIASLVPLVTDVEPVMANLASPDTQLARLFPALAATAADLALTGTQQSLLPTLGTGQGLWRIKARSFVVQHQLHPAELELFDTTARMNTNAPMNGARETAVPAAHLAGEEEGGLQ